MSEKVCVMFAGQSVQETGMGRALLKLEAGRAALERMKPALGDDLIHLITDMPEAELALTYNAQRAIHACHVGHWLAFKAKNPGVRLNGAIGHSMGVVAALTAAGALTVEDSARFIRARAESFSKACKGFTEPMGLAAVATENVEDIVDELANFPGVQLALHNTQGRGTLGGTLKALEDFAKEAEAQDWPVKIKVLKVEGPYHTPAFAACRAELSAALAGIAVKAPEVPVFMGTSGKAETDPARIKELLAAQADSRELHLQAVRAAFDAGCRTFLEASHKPQPVTWLSDQVPAGEVTARAIRTDEL
jgi:[acyl-carrier-protein] S-malonyltransferase